MFNVIVLYTVTLILSCAVQSGKGRAADRNRNSVSACVGFPVISSRFGSIFPVDTQWTYHILWYTYMNL